MCGFAGFVGPYSFDSPESVVRRMADVIQHRGPDDEGYYVDESAALGFRRLSIIDLKSGHQPMATQDQRLWIVFNGEIYNFRELRSILEAKGYTFMTSSDTEVILNAFVEWGPACVGHFNGMFALAIWDKLQRKLFLARDRLGVKPLYWATWKSCLIFSSEIKAILQFPTFPREVAPEGIDAYMSFLWTPEPQTTFRHVHKLQSGHHAVFHNENLVIDRYWNIDFEPCESLSEDEWKEETVTRLQRAVDRRLISDVPLGAFLSGGIDSTSIVALMNRSAVGSVETYTIGYDREDTKRDVIGTDLKYARLAAEKLNVRHHEIMLSPAVVDLLPKLVWHMDEPVADPAAISTYLLCKASRDTLTVLLSGVGGDEVFGGYPRFVAMKLAATYNKIPRTGRHLVESMLSRLPGGRTALFRNIKKFARSASQEFVPRYLGYRSYFTEYEKQTLYTREFQHQLDLAQSTPLKQHLELFDRASAYDPLSQMLFVDLQTFLPNLNLMYTDKMSMAASVEVREPFLDFELVEFFAHMPSRYKLKGLTRKYILKKAMEGIIPHKIIWRRKSGFGAPIRAWLNAELKPMVDELLSDRVLRERGYFQPSAVSRLIDQDRKGLEYNSNHIWQLLTLELWHRAFIDGQS